MFHIPSFQYINRHRQPRVFIIARSISADFATLNIMLFIPSLQSFQWNFGQLVRYLAALEH